MVLIESNSGAPPLSFLSPIMQVEIGKFDGAVSLNTSVFREIFPRIEHVLPENKDAPVMLYCTGGIRCVKVGAWLRGRGHTTVHYLDGGINAYQQFVRDTGSPSTFQGKNFVFDQRLLRNATQALSADVISACHTCGAPADSHANCANPLCHVLFIQCPACATRYRGTCAYQECLDGIDQTEPQRQALVDLLNARRGARNLGEDLPLTWLEQGRRRRVVPVHERPPITPLEAPSVLGRTAVPMADGAEGTQRNKRGGEAARAASSLASRQAATPMSSVPASTRPPSRALHAHTQQALHRRWATTWSETGASGLHHACHAVPVAVQAYALDHTSALSPSTRALLQRVHAETRERFPAQMQMLCGEIEGALLRMLVPARGPCHVLEIGTFTGFSALCMLDGLPCDESTLTTCELNPAHASVARGFLDAHGRGGAATILVGAALASLEALGWKRRTFDLVFVDADKGGYGAYLDALLDLRLLAPTGLAVFDNTLWKGAVVPAGVPASTLSTTAKSTVASIHAFNVRAATDARITCAVLPLRDGMTVVRWRSTPGPLPN